MKIESIKLGKRDKEKLVIRAEGGIYISAYIDDAYMLRVGDDISEEKAQELSRGYEAITAKKSAAKSLARRSMSKSELSKKLRDRGFSEEDSQNTADWFEERGYIDDEEYARSCAEYYKNRGYGKVRIREELRRRGIARDISDEAIEELGSSENELRTLIEKKLRGKPIDADGKRKLIAFLTRRGFKYEEIRAAMNDMQLDTEDLSDG